VVVASSSKVIATEVAVAVALVVVEVLVVDVEVVVAVPVVEVLVVVMLPLIGVWEAGKVPVGAAEYVPDADELLHTDGTVSPPDDPHDAGTLPARRSAAVSKAAYDQVRSYADNGVPSERENCSEREPLDCA